jgi:hypothetical protein
MGGAKQSPRQPGDCFVAPLLAMTLSQSLSLIHLAGDDNKQGKPAWMIENL